MSEHEVFIGANVSPAKYEAWSRDERLKYQTAPEKANARWIEKKCENCVPYGLWSSIVKSLLMVH